MSNRIEISPNNNDVVISSTDNKVFVVNPATPSNIEITQPITNVVEVKTGPQGPQGPPGASLDNSLFNEISPNLWFTTSSLEITGSFKVNPSTISGDIFLITSASYDVLKIKDDGGIIIQNSSPNILEINDGNSNPVLTVSQSQTIIFATQSSNPIGEAPNGGIYFTSSSLFLGLS
jgi:hypothetical protein